MFGCCGTGKGSKERTTVDDAHVKAKKPPFKVGTSAQKSGPLDTGLPAHDESSSLVANAENPDGQTSNKKNAANAGSRLEYPVHESSEDDIEAVDLNDYSAVKNANAAAAGDSADKNGTTDAARPVTKSNFASETGKKPASKGGSVLSKFTGGGGAKAGKAEQADGAASENAANTPAATSKLPPGASDEMLQGTGAIVVSNPEVATTTKKATKVGKVVPANSHPFGPPS